jgi:hypothetical protein
MARLLEAYRAEAEHGKWMNSTETPHLILCQEADPKSTKVSDQEPWIPAFTGMTNPTYGRVSYIVAGIVNKNLCCILNQSD